MYNICQYNINITIYYIEDDLISIIGILIVYL